MKKIKKVILFIEFIGSLLITYFFSVGIIYDLERHDSFVLGGLVCIVVALIKVAYRAKTVVNRYCKLLLCVTLVWIILSEICIFAGNFMSCFEQYENAEYIIVLGNKLNHGQISDTLKARLDCAIAINKELKVPIIVSGGSDAEGMASEASIMENYLRDNGVDTIIVEDQSLDTRENMLYTARIIGCNSNIVVVSSEMHIFRVRMLASKTGFCNIEAVGTQTEPYLMVYYNCREVVALLRELMLLLI